MKRKSHGRGDAEEECKSLLRVWCLRALTAPVTRSKLAGSMWLDDALSELIGISPEQLPRSYRAVPALLQERLRQVDACKPALGGVLARNLRLLGEQLELTALDREIVALLVLVRLFEPLHDVLELAGRLSDGRFDRLIGALLSRSSRQVTEALGSDGRLAGTHLVLRGASMGTFEDKFHVKDGLANAMLRDHRSLDDLISFAAMRARPAQLRLADYEHLTRHLDILLPYLGRGVSERRRGINVLLYGGAGNGKTELAKAIATELDLQLYEVRFSDDEGNPAGPAERISSYTLMQGVLCRHQRATILFDEIEDILPQDLAFAGFEMRESTRKKAWLNRMLENNAVPTIWIGNNVGHVDPAFLRRFDYVIELGPPPRSARERMLRGYLKALPVSDEWITRKADDPALTPAIVTKLAQVLELGPVRDMASLESRFDLMAQARLAVQGDTPRTDRYPYPSRYRPELLNASVNPVSVALRLATRARGSVLLYGPPGTGKTAYTHFVARKLDRPLLVKRASDLLSMWLGQTEKLIHAMFEEAISDNAVLLLDEADSFLQDRRFSQRSWEVTQVNELLTRMEQFEGIFFCATNFSEHMDPAAMRRFALKVSFEPLRREQARMLFLDTLSELQVAQPEGADCEPIWRQLDEMRALTPGDFAAARKAVDLDGFPRSAAGLVAALAGELASRPESSKRSIGFAA